MPVPISLEIGQTLTISVWIQNATSVFSYGVQMNFDPTKVQVLDADSNLPGVQVRDGNFLFVPQTLSTVNIVDNFLGRINYNNSLLDPASSVSGNGILLSFDLLATGTGVSTIGFYQIDLISPAGEYLPLNVSNAQIFTTGIPLATNSPLPTITPTFSAPPTQTALVATPTLVQQVSTFAALVTASPGIYLPMVVQENIDSQSELAETRTATAQAALFTQPPPATPTSQPSYTPPPEVPAPEPPAGQFDWSRAFAWGVVILAIGWILALAAYLIYRFWVKKAGDTF